MCFGCLVNELYNVPDFERVSYCKKWPTKKNPQNLNDVLWWEFNVLNAPHQFLLSLPTRIFGYFCVLQKSRKYYFNLEREEKHFTFSSRTSCCARTILDSSFISKKNKFIRIIELERKAIEKRAVFHLLPNIRFYWILRLNYWLSTRSSKDWDSWYKTLNRLDFSPVSVLVIKIKFSPLQHAPH